MTTPRLNRKRSLAAIGVVVWLFLVCAGMRALLSYAYTPGSSGGAPARWPASSRVAPASDRATLVMLAHPRCPCTRASLEELDRLMARLPGRIAAHVLFYLPENPPADWTKSDLWDKASSIPGVSAAWDLGGAEARRFGGETSGQVVLYDARGRVLFSGGITASRGHSGDNAGRSAIIAALTGEAPAQQRTPVFGCSLLDSRSRKGD